MSEYTEEKSTLKCPTLLELTESFLKQLVGHNSCHPFQYLILKNSLQVKYHSKKYYNFKYAQLSIYPIKFNKHLITCQALN